jgi:modification methylase
MEINNIYNIDCKKGFRRLKDGSIDLIITSPPFNLGNTHHTGTKRHKAYDDNMDENDYQKWQIEILNECYRVLKEEGSMIYQHKNRIKEGVQISPYSWIFKSKFIVKQEIIWINRSQNFDKIRFYPFTERVYWLSKDKKTKLVNSINRNDVFDSKEWKPVGTKGSHTRTFPEKFVEDMLKVFPDANLVLDPFMGSGTVAIIAKKMKRNFIGFEINKEYVDLAKKKLEDFQLDFF